MGVWRTGKKEQLSENGIIFPADSSGKSIVDNHGAAMDNPPVDRAA